MDLICDGFDSPVGTDEERQSQTLWPGNWFDATGFDRLYFVGSPSEAYHTGADLNLNKPAWDSDAHSPVYSIGSGEVSYLFRLKGWDWLLIVRHDPLPDGKVFYSRYAHMENIQVQVGDRVGRGTHLGDIGNASGRYAYHLHFDISPTDILMFDPGHWPAKNRTSLRQHYVDPLKTIALYRPL